jgi:two-component system NarL family response regulator
MRAPPAARLASGAVVLLVDDHPVVPLALRGLIEHHFDGVVALQAMSLRQARGVYQDEPRLALTVLDLRLPDVAGLEGITQLCELRPEVPVIVFTGLDSEPLRRSAAMLGAAAMVCKSESAQALLEAMRPHLVPRMQALGLSPGESDRPAPPSADGELSPRQQQMWQAIAEGLSNAEIAERYGISLNTTKAHVRELLQRLGVRNRTEAAPRFLRKRPARDD